MGAEGYLVSPAVFKTVVDGVPVLVRSIRTRPRHRFKQPYIGKGGIMMEFQSSAGRLWAENEEGKLIAEITFPEERPGVANIDHTFVDGSLRGQGVAGQLMEGAVEQLRQRGMKTVATCSYAVKWFEGHPDQRDLLAE